MMSDAARFAAPVRGGRHRMWGRPPMPPEPEVKDVRMQQLIAWMPAFD
jgi:cytochrome c551/c552